MNIVNYMKTKLDEISKKIGNASNLKINLTRNSANT